MDTSCVNIIKYIPEDYGPEIGLKITNIPFLEPLFTLKDMTTV